jgi:hypothetical protein
MKVLADLPNTDPALFNVPDAGHGAPLEFGEAGRVNQKGL